MMMSYSHQYNFIYSLQMSLIAEVLQKIRLLLDKPISTLTRNQIVQLVNKKAASSDDLLVIFARKYRSDLLLHLIANQPVTTQKLQFLLGLLLDKLLQFKIEDALSLWKPILGKEQLKGVRQYWTERLLKDALKNTNQTLKNSQLQLLKENASLLWQWNQGRVFQDFARNYCSSFLKINIYLAPYPAILHFLTSKAEAVQTDIIQNDMRKQLVARLVQFLNFTKAKQFFLFQNQCLRAITLILQSKKTKMDDIILIYACQKMLEQYLWKKPTRQQAYACKQAAKKTQQSLDQQNKDKMSRNYELNEPKAQKQIFIEEVIDKTNVYRKNNQLIINKSQIDSNFHKSSFLKRGVGNGGGKSSISPQPKTKYQVSGLDQLVQSCFRKTDQSFVRKQQKVQPQSLYQSSMYASTITIQDDQRFEQISNLIDLAYSYKFDIRSSQ